MSAIKGDIMATGKVLPEALFLLLKIIHLPVNL
jgi:hypothetical protein